MLRPIFALLFSLSMSSLAFAAETPAPYPMASEARVQQVKDLTFGMWTCWSLSTFTNQEYTKGVTDPNYFNVTGCDPDQWASTAKAAGMKYLLVLPKHHDGFCLWDTKTTKFNVMQSPLKKDALAEIRKACDKQGIKLALYWSMPDWTWPGNADAAKQKAQLEELFTKYGPIEFVWMDEGGIGNGGLSHTEAAAWIKKFQPDCLLGFNCRDPQGEIRIGEQGFAGPLEDIKAAGNLWEAYAQYKNFSISEFCYPITTWRGWGMGTPFHGPSASRWFYMGPEHDQLAVVSAEQIFNDYQRAKKYGNLFNLDVSPNRAGKLRDIDVKTLTKVGQYIRGEIPSPFLFGRPGFKTEASSVYNNQWYDHAPEFLFDGRRDVGWGPNGKTGWIQFDLGKPQALARVIVDEGDLNRIRGWEFQCQDNGQWKTLATGKTLGPKHEIAFPKTTAQVFRLVITDATAIPGLWEIEIPGFQGN
jgi:alpha-L-fucosidase